MKYKSLWVACLAIVLLKVFATSAARAQQSHPPAKPAEIRAAPPSTDAGSSANPDAAASSEKVVSEQQIEIRDAGGGRKIELIYNASGQVVETRTLDSAGRLQARVEYEYRSGFYVPQETTTSYWPDGKAIRSVTRVGYDENANFAGEVIELFNEAGTQTGGTKLTHDPFTGIFRCSKWDVSARAYQATECPATEESAEAPKKAKELTLDEAMKQLELARQAQREDQKVRRMERKSPIQPPITAAVKQIGVIVPAELHPGERVSGSVVDDPQKYEGVQNLGVIQMELPAESQGEAATLGGWAFEAAADEGPQRADGPIVFTVPSGPEFTVTLRQVGNPAHAVSHAITVAKNSQLQKRTKSLAFEAPALCLKGDLCPVRGPFGGDSTKTLIAFGSRPAPIVAETEDTAYITVPVGLPTGPTHLIVAEGSQIAALPVDVAELSLSPNRRELHQGETLLIHAVLSGPEELAEEQWRAGVPAAASVERARSLVPGFEPPQEGKEAAILVVIRNATPEAVSLRGSKNQTFVFELTPESFKNGEFKYHFVVEAVTSASFALRGTVLSFLAPVQGQQFQVKAGGPAK